ncbi:hypothetical protein HKCCE2091_21345 [Rhodobacterales bacterium HKCCE2091]|nr:hypothetical protein [Rhodobacterales bacterium HKCCE2091]
MTDYLSKELRDGLAAVDENAPRRGRRTLSIRVGDAVYPILRVSDRGFAMETAAAPRLRGFVDIYDGQRHLTRALVVALGEQDGMTSYEFKSKTVAADRPPVDFVLPDGKPGDPRPGDL